ncbi:MAG: hypothetical protein ACRBF0_12670 [Calditrichia bacterium]
MEKQLITNYIEFMSVKSPGIHCVILLIFLGSCTNPFATRMPEPPTSGDNLVTSQSDPEQLIAKIRSAFDVQLSSTYEQCFDSLFTFLGAGSDASELSNWDRMREIAYFQQLVQDEQVESAVLNLPEDGDPVFTPITQDEEEVRFQYEILLGLRTGQRVERYQGRVILRVVKSSQENWFVRSWQDLETTSGNDSTWSTLRAKYR